MALPAVAAPIAESMVGRRLLQVSAVDSLAAALLAPIAESYQRELGTRGLRQALEAAAPAPAEASPVAAATAEQMGPSAAEISPTGRRLAQAGSEGPMTQSEREALLLLVAAAPVGESSLLSSGGRRLRQAEEVCGRAAGCAARAGAGQPCASHSAPAAVRLPLPQRLRSLRAPLRRCTPAGRPQRVERVHDPVRGGSPHG